MNLNKKLKHKKNLKSFEKKENYVITHNEQSRNWIGNPHIKRLEKYWIDKQLEKNCSFTAQKNKKKTIIVLLSAQNYLYK